ncbi:YceI family protein [Ahrensia sp. R2A130]|uniref:YceI family protein n=1 Tax=Ahrensia sp. R2A130 TaxID=744979 RepID=UPI0001E094A0|nr:YceI family protein [Ahrensia sp. R2A130]EFL88356.1 cytochrome B561 [Ahrensia sp. R2A130]
MQLTNTRERYGLVHQILHWAVALLIITMLPMGVIMGWLPATNPDEIADKVWLYGLHKSIGIAALALALIRIGWVLTQTKPAPLHDGMEGFASRAVHDLLYASIILLPVTGWIHHAASTGYSPIWWGFGDTLPLVPKSDAVSRFFNSAHFVFAITLVGSLGLHIAGALKHAVIDKDKTLARMVPGADLSGEMPMVRIPHDHNPLFAAVAVLLVSAVAVVVVDRIYTPEAPVAAVVETPAATVEQAAEAASVTAGAWVIDQAQSTLGVTIRQMGSPVSGSFGEWSADVVFDPTDPASGSIDATVQTATFQMGDNTARAIGDEFLATGANPTARFVSESIGTTDTGYRATGMLMLSGTEAPAVIDFTFAEADGVATVSATIPIKRLDFGVGAGFPAGDTVGLDVDVVMDIRATRP